MAEDTAPEGAPKEEDVPKEVAVKAPTVTVDRAKLEKAMILDRHRRAGGTTPGSEDDVKVVTQALVEEGLLASAGDGAFDQTVHNALAKFGTLEGLAKKHHFKLSAVKRKR